jgi:hypothetical protein
MSQNMPLHKGEVRYLGHRPELEAGLYAIRPTDGTPPIPLGRLIAQAPAMLRVVKAYLTAFRFFDHIEGHSGDDCFHCEARAILRAVEEEK